MLGTWLDTQMDMEPTLKYAATCNLLSSCPMCWSGVKCACPEDAFSSAAAH